MTLSELSICEDVQEYRFKFTSENSNDYVEELVASPTNTSGRLQVFNIEEGVDITFPHCGYYSYEVYQTTQNNLVEVGLLRVRENVTSSPIVTFDQNVQVYGE